VESCPPKFYRETMTYASQVHRFARFNQRFGRIFIPAWISLAAIFTCAATADAVWHFGWGYRWQDALAGLGMVAFGFLFWGVWNFMLKLIRSFNEMRFGSDPDRRDTEG
jgi:O-antigen/teichoic acid export membrane protein